MSQITAKPKYEKAIIFAWHRLCFAAPPVHRAEATQGMCPECGYGEIRRSHRRAFDRLLSLASIYPFRCLRCDRRFFAFRPYSGGAEYLGARAYLGSLLGVGPALAVRAGHATLIPDPPATSYLLIVRRDCPEVYAKLHALTDGRVTFVQDRRHRDRRDQEGPVAVERRTHDRRGALPSTWSVLGFLLHHVETVATSATRPGGHMREEEQSCRH